MLNIYFIIIFTLQAVQSSIDVQSYNELLSDVMDKDFESSNRVPRSADNLFSGARELLVSCPSTLSKTCWLEDTVEEEGSGGSFVGNKCNCQCNIGYRETRDKNCIKVSVFGGGLVYTSPHHAYNCQDLNTTTEDLLTSAYGNNTWFEQVIMTSQRQLSSTDDDITKYVVLYELSFDAIANVKDLQVTQTLESYCGNITSLTFGNFSLNCEESVKFTTDQLKECGSLYSNYCDVTSTTCHVKDGEVYCSCRHNYYNSDQSHFTTCTEQVCNADYHCTSPFGKCLRSSDTRIQSMCQCFWGFTGSNCRNYTVFIMTCAIGFILLVIIFILLCRCCRNNEHHNNKKGESRSDVLGTLADLSEVQFDFQPGQMRARVPTRNKPPGNGGFPRSATSTFSAPSSANTSSGGRGRMESGIGLHHYTNQSFIHADQKHARAHFNKDLKRADYF